MPRNSQVSAIVVFCALHLQGQVSAYAQAPPGSQNAVKLASSLLGRRSTENTKARVDVFRRPFRGQKGNPEAQLVCGSTVGNTETNNPVTCTVQIQAPQGTTSLPIEVVEAAAVAVYQQTCGGGSSYCQDSLTLTIAGPDGAVLFSESLNTNGGALPAVPNPPFVLDTAAEYPQNGGCGITWNCYNRVFGGSLGVGQYTANGPASITITQTYIGYGEYDTSGLVLYMPPPITAIDPFPALMTENGLLQDSQSLATLGTPVGGVAADGAAFLVLRMPASAAGDQIQLTLFNDQNIQSSSAQEDGELSTIDGATASSQINITAVNTDEGPMAFALYVPPTDFARSSVANDATTYERSVSVLAVDQSGSGITDARRSKLSPAGPPEQLQSQIFIDRPPIFMIHGLWGDKSNFDPIMAALAVGGQPDSPVQVFCTMCLFAADYSMLVPVTFLAPPNGLKVPTQIPGNSVGPGYDAQLLLPAIKNLVIKTYKQSLSRAATQADVVGHSMGGLVARTMYGLPQYNPVSFNAGKGYIHKLLTIGTPHGGSPLAPALLAPQNSCVADALARIGNYSFATVGVGTTYYDGAIADLTPPALGSFADLPTLMLSFTASLAGAGTGWTGSALRGGCGSSPLATALTPAGWLALMEGPSDAIVPVSSQSGATGPSIQLQGMVHSPGTEALGFSGPSEVDANYYDSSYSVVRYIIAWSNASVGSLGQAVIRRR